MKAANQADADAQKKAAALAALKFVKAGMKLGLGTGSTANHFIRAVAEEVRHGLQVRCVATSKASADLAQSLGVALTTLEDEPRLDLTVDGADEFDAELRLIKGGGGALLIEKIVATSSKQVVIITDETKQVKKLGTFPLPIEIVPLGIKATEWKIADVFQRFGMAPELTLRQRGGSTFHTDLGNVIIDAACGEIPDPDGLENALNNIAGVVDNGLFCGLANFVLMATARGVVEIARP
jgi:ribose 5-phosphate isomerase A